MFHLRAAVVAAAVMFSGSAVAGDMGRQPPAPIWNGLYVGAHAGWGSTTVSSVDGSFDMTGGLGGVHVGYNALRGGILLGLEMDATASSIERSASLYGATLKVQLDGLASIRARIGVPVGNMMLYATGGAAYATGSVGASAYGSSISVNISSVGLVGGAGIEAQLTDRVSMRAEALRYAFSDIEAEGQRTGLDLSTTVVRAGVTWHMK